MWRAIRFAIVVFPVPMFPSMVTICVGIAQEQQPESGEQSAARDQSPRRGDA